MFEFPVQHICIDYTIFLLKKKPQIYCARSMLCPKTLFGTKYFKSQIFLFATMMEAAPYEKLFKPE
jgi:hypothetical protein